MSKNHPNLSTMAGFFFDIYVTQMSKNHKLCTMVEEKFEIYLTRMPKNPETP